jgi:hypothetical protein
MRTRRRMRALPWWGEERKEEGGQSVGPLREDALGRASFGTASQPGCCDKTAARLARKM